MGAYWLRSKLLTKAIIKDASCEDDRLCKIVLSGSNEQLPKRIVVYMPLSSDKDENYLIDQEVVSRAIHRQATHLVYEMWISGVTLAAYEYAQDNNITIMEVGDFLSKIDRGLYP
jgi:hypothetical protein